jgi:hypothetical protein
MRMPRLVAALALAAVTTVAVDEAMAFSRATEKACQSDYKRLCPSYQNDTADLRYCMEANARSISERCLRAAVNNGDVPRSRVRALGYNF